MYKIKDIIYDKETGTSYAEITTELGNFAGYAFLNPEDKEIESNFLGCEIAEYRAVINYLKEARYRVNIGLHALYKARNMFKKSNQDYSTLEKIIANYEEENEEYKQDIQEINNAIDKKLDDRIRILNKITKKKEKDSK